MKQFIYLFNKKVPEYTLTNLYEKSVLRLIGKLYNNACKAFFLKKSVFHFNVAKLVN